MAKGKSRPNAPMAASGPSNPAPQLKSGAVFTDFGTTGLRAYGGYVREEFLPALVGRQGVTVYREMLDNSPIIGALMFAIQGAMRKVEWRTEPANDTPAAAEAAEFADSLRSDMSTTWEEFIVEALSMLGYGYSFHEICYKRRAGNQPFGGAKPSSKYKDGAIGWARLPVRSQDTVLKWFFSPNGEILGMTQQPWFGPIVDIPMEKGLLFRPSQYKNSPEGRSILRSAYRPFYFVKRLEEGEAIYIERMSGNVVVRVPTALLEQAAGGDVKALAALNVYKQIAVNSRRDEQMGLLLPSDTFAGANGPSTVPMFGYEYVVPQGGRAGTDANTPIVRHKLDILTSVLCDFIQMGHTARGAQNLAETKVDLFLNAIEAWLNSVAAVLNQDALGRIWALNGFDRDLMPRYVPDLAQQVDLDVFSNIILRLSQSGVKLFPDEDLEAYSRDVFGFPKAPEGTQWQQVDPATPAAPADEASAVAKQVMAAVMAAQAKRKRAS
jgi:hypothetical protein